MDIVPNTEAGLGMYWSDIIGFLKRSITSSLWNLKSLAAAAIESTANSLKSTLNPDQIAILLRILLDELTGRTWEGKEHLLRALAYLVSTHTIEDVLVRGIFIHLFLYNFQWTNVLCINEK